MNELQSDVNLFMKLLKASIEEFNLYWEVTTDGDFIFSRGAEKIVINKNDIVKYFNE